VAREIERKFLVANDQWRAEVVRAERLVDGLLSTAKGRKVRVRLYGDHATLTIKTSKKRGSRLEFEYPIPWTDAQYLLECECGKSVVSKVRHDVPFEGFTWQVDVYEGLLVGVIVAEVELASIDQDPPRPTWVGREVTDDPAFRKQRLVAERILRRFGPKAPSKRVKPRAKPRRSSPRALAAT
jgi:adenylate cyclase